MYSNEVFTLESQHGLLSFSFYSFIYMFAKLFFSLSLIYTQNVFNITLRLSKLHFSMIKQSV